MSTKYWRAIIRPGIRCIFEGPGCMTSPSAWRHHQERGKKSMWIQVHCPLSSHKASGIYWHLPHGTQVQWWGGTSIRALSEYGGPVAQISILVTRKTQILSLKAEFVDKIQKMSNKKYTIWILLFCPTNMCLLVLGNLFDIICPDKHELTCVLEGSFAR